MKLLIVGNCQFRTIHDVLKICLPEATIVSYRIDDKKLLDEDLNSFDYILSHKFADRFGNFSEVELSERPNVYFIPYVVFSGYHPDCIYHVKTENGDLLPSPVNKNSYHSLIVACAFIKGIKLEETKHLFNRQFYDLLNYFSYKDVAERTLVEEIDSCDMPGQVLLDKWNAQGRFMYTVNHCKSHVLIDIGIQLANKIKPCLSYLNEVNRYNFEDYLALDADFYSIYDKESNRILKRSLEKSGDGARSLELFKFAEESYYIYESYDGRISVEAKYLERFDEAYKKYCSKNTIKTIPNPYKAIENKQFWKRSVHKDIGKVDLSIRPKFEINKSTRVATAGSCFAQHIARSLHNSGYTYYVAEKAPTDLSDEKAKELSYGLFTSRYGNIYTVKQLVQLFERAFGIFTPQEKAWRTQYGFIDPFRPNIGEVFSAEEKVESSKSVHLAAVRDQFKSLDLFVFTLGLTEAWEDSEDGAVFPVCPYAVAEQTNNKFRFVNYDYAEIYADLNKFIHYVALVNPAAKILLTVSPVPLIATYENQHVLTSTTESKAILRSVAGKVAKQYRHIEYFPSFEIITGSYAESTFFEDNLREVKPEGVKSVMQTFYKSFENQSEIAERNSDLAEKDEFISAEHAKVNDIVCDEELLDQ